MTMRALEEELATEWEGVVAESIGRQECGVLEAK